MRNFPHSPCALGYSCPAHTPINLPPSSDPVWSDPWLVQCGDLA